MAIAHQVTEQLIREETRRDERACSHVSAQGFNVCLQFINRRSDGNLLNHRATLSISEIRQRNDRPSKYYAAERQR